MDLPGERYSSDGNEAMSIALVFPGQGSQSIGMMRGFDELPVVRETFIEAGDTLGVNLWNLVTEGPVESLNQTINTQPVMLTAGIAVFRAWQQCGGKPPTVIAGHSLGEYTALVASGAITFPDAVTLVRFRAEVMQQAVPEGEGGIAAIIGLDDDSVKAACDTAAQGQIVEAVNFNSPNQVVIAGHKTAVERAIAIALERGAKKGLMLPMSVPSHCSLMKSASDKLRAHLDTIVFYPPKIPVIQNADVASYDEPNRIKDALARQLYRPVRWVDTIQIFVQRYRVSKVIESAPGKVLTGLAKRIDSRLQLISLADADSLKQALIQV